MRKKKVLRRSRLYLLITLLVLLRDVLSEVAKISMSQIFRKATSFAWACYHVTEEKQERSAPSEEVSREPSFQVFRSPYISKVHGRRNGIFLGGRGLVTWENFEIVVFPNG